MARIVDLIAAGHTFSFEFFPPKDEDEQRLLTRTISDLQPLQPSFVSVTYRGGRISRERTTRAVIDLLRTTDLPPAPPPTRAAPPAPPPDAAPSLRCASALRARRDHRRFPGGRPREPACARRRPATRRG